ncbi:CFEM domain-containing protein [Aspergillus lucknowensis]|uniref:CFEM domain-containing protein n=1 Tax=Aspergillus lucknowensis TaxID=176173 RepID=A0ABR4LL00_9EURO
MKFSAIFAIALATLAASQTVNDIPKCAIPCLDDAIKSKTNCKTTDYKCVCKKENFDKVQGAATGCVIQKCGSDVAINQVLPATKKLCAAQ